MLCLKNVQNAERFIPYVRGYVIKRYGVNIMRHHISFVGVQL